MRTVKEVSRITGVSVRTLHHYDFDSNLAITQQIRLLELQQERIGKLITFAREIQEKGVCKMEFDVFDKSNIEQYKEEVKSRWGQSEAYQEFVQKQENGEDFDKAGKALMALFEEILKGLGTMYAEDERFRQNIDKAGGNGTAEFVRWAIEVYCCGE